jgi:hypothetical protein
MAIFARAISVPDRNLLRHFQSTGDAFSGGW